ncbi:MAG: hypothetical protein K8R53_16425, partial [Bacteroidales bacterium]|nr:hypothetical protein [Bacteroidales bacterium]
MKKAQALEAIDGPCKYAGVELEADCDKKILERLSGKSGFIELTWLQVIMDTLYKKAIEKNSGPNIISSEDVDRLGKMGDVLGNFLDEQLKAMENGELGEALLKAMITAEGTKKQVSIEEINTALQNIGHDLTAEKIQEILQHLINVRIISDRDEQGRYELKHDSLAAKIYEKLTLAEKELMEVRQFVEYAYQNYQSRKKHLSADDLKYIAPYEGKLFLSERLNRFIHETQNEIQKDRRKKRNFWIGAGLLLILIMAGFTWWAMIERNHANEISINSRSNDLAVHAINIVKNDPTGAFLLAEQAFKIYPSYYAKRALFESFRNYPFYNIVQGGELVMAKDKSFSITVLNDSLARIWNNQFQKISDIPHKEQIWMESSQKNNHPQISKDGTLIATNVDSTIYIWDTYGELIKKIQVKTNNFTYYFSNNNSYLVISNKYNWSIIDIKSSNIILTGKGPANSYPNFITFSRKDDYLFIE